MSWEESLADAYYPAGKFKHASPKHITLFPYTTSDVPAKTVCEMHSFFAVSGEALRELAEVESEVVCSSSSVISNIKDKIDTEKFADLEHIVKTTMFDESGQISCFHPTIFYHLVSKGKDKNAISFAQFVCDVLFEGDEQLAPQQSVGEGELNVFHSLILNNLPPLKSRKNKDRNSYYKAKDPLCDSFVKDCLFLKSHPKLYATKLPELVKFYFFIYQLRLVESLNSFLTPKDHQSFFFTVDWESLSKGRQSYLAGWKRVESRVLNLFSHVHCLELLNHVPVEGLESPYIYSDIKKWMEMAPVSEKNKLLVNLESLIEFYKTGIESLGFNWGKVDLADDESTDIEGKVNYLFRLVQHQFKFSSRKAASNRYSKWLLQFAVSNFLKRRGPLGNTLCFSRTQLLFLTRLCIGDNPSGKLRLTELWQEFRKRGVDFDFESKKQVVNLFNKLNVIEKKSDSGDAQYVRAIF